MFTILYIHSTTLSVALFAKFSNNYSDLQTNLLK